VGVKGGVFIHWGYGSDIWGGGGGWWLGRSGVWEKQTGGYPSSEIMSIRPRVKLFKKNRKKKRQIRDMTEKPSKKE